MKFLDQPPRFLFFTGKGGVGKTSLACATAVHLADAGKRVLLVSTDPASNVGQVFGVAIGNRITADRRGAGPVRRWRSTRRRPRRPTATASSARCAACCRMTVVKGIEEQLSGACTTEIAAFDEFTALLTDAALTARLRSHHLRHRADRPHHPPAAAARRLERLPRSRQGRRLLPRARWPAWRSSARSTRPPWTRWPTRRAPAWCWWRARSTSTLREAARTHEELAAIGLRAAVPGRSTACCRQPRPATTRWPRAIVRARAGGAGGHAGGAARAAARPDRRSSPSTWSACDALRQLLARHAPAARRRRCRPQRRRWQAPSLAALVDEIAADGHGLVMLMGKGGVGKTTLAAAVAVELAAPRPAGAPDHLRPGGASGGDAGRHAGAPHASAASIRTWRPSATAQHVLATKGAELDAAGRALLEEDLRSPCTEEIAVFQAFSRVIREAGRKFVVMDTAPTGHTLLLLDATGAYHRDIVRQMGGTRRALHHADDAAAGPEADQGADRHAGRDHAGARSRQPAGRPAPRRHRALGLGHQQQRGGGATALAAAAPARAATSCARSRPWPRSHAARATPSCRC